MERTSAEQNILNLTDMQIGMKERQILSFKNEKLLYHVTNLLECLSQYIFVITLQNHFMACTLSSHFLVCECRKFV